MRGVIPEGLMVILIAGCATVGQSRVRTAIETGVLPVRGDTKEKVQSLLGAPIQFSRTADGLEQWYFAYSASSVSPGWFIPIIGPFVAPVEARAWKVFIVFDEDGRVLTVDKTITDVRATAFGATRTDSPVLDPPKDDRRMTQPESWVKPDGTRATRAQVDRCIRRSRLKREDPLDEKLLLLGNCMKNEGFALD
jgi:hypothetical protein